MFVREQFVLYKHLCVRYISLTQELYFITVIRGTQCTNVCVNNSAKVATC